MIPGPQASKASFRSCLYRIAAAGSHKYSEIAGQLVQHAPARGNKTKPAPGKARSRKGKLVFLLILVAVEVVVGFALAARRSYRLRQRKAALIVSIGVRIRIGLFTVVYHRFRGYKVVQAADAARLRQCVERVLV